MADAEARALGSGGASETVRIRGPPLSELRLLPRFLDASGSFRKTHSRPRKVHLAHGCCWLHLILDSAQACRGFSCI